jgi:hypothetical protein
MTTKKKAVKKKVKKKNPTYEFQRFLIGKFLDPNKTNWPREMKIAEYLVGLYDSEDFWKTVSLSCDLPSLAFFRTQNGIKLLEEKKQIFDREYVAPREKPVMSSSKQGEDFEPDPKPKTLKDFLS